MTKSFIAFGNATVYLKVQSQTLKGLCCWNNLCILCEEVMKALRV